MLAAGARAGGRRGPAARALARALRTTALDRASAGEREWIARIEAWRRELPGLADHRDADELGVANLRSAVEWMSVPPVLGRFLMRLVRELRPRSCLELGTGFGLSGAYQAAALELNGTGRLLTLDVAERWAGVAREGFAALGLERVEVRVGEPSEALSEALRGSAPLDYAFIDADHQEAPTMAALETILPHLSPQAAIVLDDVGFSLPEMARAWRRIGADPRVSLAVRFGRMGAVLLSGAHGGPTPPLR
jgi:predicted O-methyltransferase YrrM